MPRPQSGYGPNEVVLAADAPGDRMPCVPSERQSPVILTARRVSIAARRCSVRSGLRMTRCKSASPVPRKIACLPSVQHVKGKIRTCRCISLLTGAARYSSDGDVAPCSATVFNRKIGACGELCACLQEQRNLLCRVQAWQRPWLAARTPRRGFLWSSVTRCSCATPPNRRGGGRDELKGEGQCVDRARWALRTGSGHLNQTRVRSKR